MAVKQMVYPLRYNPSTWLTRRDNIFRIFFAFFDSFPNLQQRKIRVKKKNGNRVQSWLLQVMVVVHEKGNRMISLNCDVKIPVCLIPFRAPEGLICAPEEPLLEFNGERLDVAIL